MVIVVKSMGLLNASVDYDYGSIIIIIIIIIIILLVDAFISTFPNNSKRRRAQSIFKPAASGR